MAQFYRLEVTAPATATKAGFTQNFTPDSGDVLSIDAEIKKDHRAISTLNARLIDPAWTTFSALPDCAYFNVGVKLYMGTAGRPRDVSHLVFDGKATQYKSSFPGPQTTQLTAHDKSIDLRRKQRAKTYTGKTSTQIAQQILGDYGLDVDVSTGSLSIATRLISIGGESSDWDHMTRELAADGLELIYDHKAGRFKVRQLAATNYPTFKRGEPPIVSLSVEVNHIRGPGMGGDKAGTLDTEQTTGTAKAIPAGSPTARGAAREGASQRTGRQPNQSPTTSATGAHSEDASGRSAWTNQVDIKRRRKDSATLICTPLPDITLGHVAQIAGFGAKADGPWNIESIHQILVGSGARQTTLSLKRSTSPGGAKQTGVVGLDTEATT